MPCLADGVVRGQRSLETAKVNNLIDYGLYILSTPRVLLKIGSSSLVVRPGFIRLLSDVKESTRFRLQKRTRTREPNKIKNFTFLNNKNSLWDCGARCHPPNCDI